MKNKVLSVLVSAAFVAISHSATNSIQVYSSYGPTIASAFAVYSGKVQAFLQNGKMPDTSNNNPTNFALATWFDYDRAMASTNSLWDGILSSSQFGDQRGGRLIFPIKIQSSTAFTPSEVLVDIRSNDPYTDHPLGSLGFTPVLSTWAPEAVGLWWGADGVKGTSDDEIRVSGTNLVNELWYTGPGIGYDVQNQSDIDVVKTYMHSLGSSFAVTATVTVKEGDGTVIVPSVMNMIGMSGGSARIVLSPDKKSWIVDPLSKYRYLVQESLDMKTWTNSPSTVPVTGGESVATLGTSGSKFFRLYQGP